MKEPDAEAQRRWVFSCPAHLASLEAFRQQVREVYADPCAAGRVAPGESDKMQLALHEVLVNIIEHSVREAGEADYSIRIETALFADRIEWTFAHDRRFFAPESIPVPRADGSQLRGYGLFIIEQTADRVRYYRNAQGESCVSLVKGFSPPPQAGATGEVQS